MAFQRLPSARPAYRGAQDGRQRSPTPSRPALVRLSAAGATVVLPMAEFTQAAAVNPRGALTSAEAYSWHRQWMKDGADKYDPRVLVRIRSGETMTAANYIETLRRACSAAAGTS
jgi:Asp-tRNA(Asn)/Glu-tRNA(Gln) amidotransferase A subunit family amidase